MSIRDNIPEKVLESLNTSKFVDVLDAVQSTEFLAITKAHRIHNAAICTDKKWLIKDLENYGVVDFPFEIPLAVMQQFLLNLNTVTSIKGSKKGIEFYCSVLSLGEVSVDDSLFYSNSGIFLLNSPTSGTIVGNSEDSKNYLVGNNAEINPKIFLTIAVASRYIKGTYQAIVTSGGYYFSEDAPTDPEETAIIDYINSTIGEQLYFSPNKEITINYSNRNNYFFHELLNTDFV